MGEALFLDVPVEDQTESLIDEYYDYRRQKRDGLSATDDSEYETPESDRQTALDDFRETGTARLSESVPSDSASVDPHYDRIVDIFTDEGDGDPLAEPQRIERVRDHFRAIKVGLQAMNGGPERTDGPSFTPADREIQFETGPIALCEFALERGYGVSFDS